MYSSTESKGLAMRRAISHFVSEYVCEHTNMRAHMRSIIFTAIALAAMTGAGAAAQDVGGYGQTCARPSGVESARKRSELPSALRDEFKGIAMPGEFWNQGDFGIPGNGLTLIWHIGKRWVVIEGHGGIATWFGVRAFDVS